MRRRRLFLVPITGWGNEVFDKGIEDQATAVERVWADSRLGSERAFTVVRSEPPDRPEDLQGFVDRQNFLGTRTKKERESGAPYAVTERDAIVVYITGHGERFSDGHHYFQMPGARDEKFRSLHFRTSYLLERVLESEAEHVLIMIDSCYSGTVAAEVRELLNHLGADQTNPGTVLVMTSAVKDGKPRLGQFVRTLERVWNTLFEDHEGDYERPWLTTNEFCTLIDQVYKEEHAGEGDPANPLIVWPDREAALQAAGDKVNFALPNPAYRPSRGRSDVELDPAWVDVVSGASPAREGWSSREQGWFFTDRNELLRPIVRFLISGEGALVVTGAAGSGKSALLGYAVAFSHHGFREDPTYRGPIGHAERQRLLPPAGAVNAAVRAGGLTVDQAAEDLLRQIEPAMRRMPGKRMSECFLEAVGALVQEDGRMVTVVIDGLDEAEDPDRLITDLVQPLRSLRGKNGRRCVRLLLGVRSEQGESREGGPRLLGSLLNTGREADPRPLRTDDRDEVTHHIEQFSLRRLRDQRGEDDCALELLAKAVAREVTPSFLEAGIVSADINEETDGLPDLEDPTWWSDLQQGVQGLIRRDIEAVAQTTGADPRTLVAVLRSLAFAGGDGLPEDELWPKVVEGISARTVSSDEALGGIQAVLNGRLIGYLRRSESNGQRTYRPLHERIAELLRGDPAHLTGGKKSLDLPDDVVETHRRFAVALSALLSRDDPPHEYTRRFLVPHAAKGGVLNDELVPFFFLPYERSGRVRSLLEPLGEGETTRMLAIYAAGEPWLDPSDTEMTRADSLALALFDHGVRVDGGDVVPSWRDFVVRGNVLAHERQHGVLATSFFLPEPGGEERRVVVGDGRGQVFVWDVQTGSLVGEPRTVAEGASTLVLASARSKKGSRRLLTGTERGVMSHDLFSSAKAHVVLEGSVAAIVAGTEEGAYLTVGTDQGLFRLDPWVPLRRRVDDRKEVGPVHDLSLLPGAGGERSLLAVSYENRVEVLDADTWDLVTTVPVEARGGFTRVVLYADARGRPRLVTAGVGGSLQVQDALTGDSRSGHTRLAVTALVRCERPGKGDLLGLGRPDRSVWLWDPERGRVHRRFPQDHGQPVTSLAVVPDEQGALVLASGSSDGSVRLWDPRAGTEAWRSPSAPGTRLVSCAGEDGRPLILSPGRREEIHVRSARDGTYLNDFHLPGPATALAAFEHPERGWVVVAGLANGTIVSRDTSGDGFCSPISPGLGLGEHATAFAVYRNREARTLLVVGTSRGGILYCDPVDGDVADRHLSVSDKPVRDLAVLREPEPFVVAATDEGVRVWKPSSAGEPRPLGGLTGGARALTAYSDEILAIGGTDGLIRCWSSDTEETVELGGHRGAVAALAPLPSWWGTGHLVSVGADDTTMRVWDVRTGGELTRLVTGMCLTSLCLPGQGNGPEEDSLVVFGGPSGTAAVAVRLPASEKEAPPSRLPSQLVGPGR